MSPSIRDLFGDPDLDEPGGDAPFDPSNLQGMLNDVLSGRPVAGAPAGYVSEGEPLAGDGTPPPAPLDAAPVEGGTDAAVPPPAASTPPTSVPPAATDTPTGASPFNDLSDTELLELYEVRKALQDPERAVRIKQAYLGIDGAPPAAAPPAAVAPPVPTLPEHIEPGSFEAQMWQENQDLRAEMREVKGLVTQQGAQTEQQRSLAAAEAAGRNFTAKYGDRLSADEIRAVAQLAGAQRLPNAFMSAGDSVEQAMERSLEYVLRSNDVLLGKVLGAPSVPAVPQFPGNAPAANDRKRVLHALSSAASPAGEQPTRTPITHREDGRLSEQSRLTVVQELVNRMRGSDEGIV